MSFKSLYKEYVMNNIDKFNEIYNNRINSPATVKFDFDINGNQAFFVYDSDIMKYVSVINELNAKIDEIYKSLPEIAKEQYIRNLLIDEIKFTNEIEGIVLNKKDINDLIDEIESKTKTKNRFEGIVKKYLLLINYDIALDTPEDIRALYDEMLYNEIKEEDERNLPDGIIFRKDIVHVYKSGTKIVHNGITPEQKIIDYMNKALAILNNEEILALIRVAIFHYLFGYIHPFYDGNGRINRLISSYVLSKYFNDTLSFRLSMTIKENLTQYLEAVDHTNDSRNKGDITTFIYEFLDIVYKSCQKTQLYGLESLKNFRKYEKILDTIIDLQKNEKEALDILIQSSIFGDFGLTRTYISDKIGKGKTKTIEILKKLKDKNLCQETNSKRHIYYKANLEELDKYEIN